MVNSTISQNSDIIESIDVDQGNDQDQDHQNQYQEQDHQNQYQDQDQDQDTSKTKHLFSTEIFERDELWNDFNIVQQVDINHSNKTSSGVWKYFGKLHYDNQIVDEGFFYCISCYSNRVTKKYQTNTSTGNLIKHMIRAHDILLEQPVYRIKRDNGSYTVIKEEYKGGLEAFHIDPNDDLVYDINQILIDEVQKRPQLYDPKQCHKNKHRIRQDLWFQVYETLNHIIPLERLPKIWKNIRDRYQKVRRSCEKDESKVPKYRYYDKLRFLDSVIDSQMKMSQSALNKMEDDDSKDGYFMEDKNPEGMFEVLELDVDDMDNVEVSHENNESYNNETVNNTIEIKCEAVTRRRHLTSEMDETDELGHYEFQNTSEIDESDLFPIDNGAADVQPPSAKRAKNNPATNYEQNHHQPITSTPLAKADGGAMKSLAVGEFDLFGNYLAAVMKNMRKNNARQLQVKIIELINSFDEDESV